MTAEPLPRSRAARETAEAALLHIVRHYGERPEFVVLGGLVPELLCAGSAFQHAGTTDVDVQVDLEIACGAANAARLERALRNAGCVPEESRPWHWSTGGNSAAAVVKFELRTSAAPASQPVTSRCANCTPGSMGSPAPPR